LFISCFLIKRTGIPQKVVDNIFQPFFTTIPIAIGMKIETKEGEGAEFIRELPV